MYPQLWINDGMLDLRVDVRALIAATLLFAYRLWDSRSWLDAALLGGAIGLAALTRPEAVILVPLVGVPFLFVRSTGDLEAPHPSCSCCIGATCLVVIAPWWVRNLTTFENRSFLATGHGVVLQSANCDGRTRGQFLGYWDIDCITAARHRQNAQQERSAPQQGRPGRRVPPRPGPARRIGRSTPGPATKAFHYIEDHLSRVPVVVAARVGRVWGVFRPART